MVFQALKIIKIIQRETANFKSVEKYYRCACKAKVKHQNKYDKLITMFVKIIDNIFKNTQSHA